MIPFHYKFLSVNYSTFITFPYTCSQHMNMTYSYVENTTRKLRYYKCGVLLINILDIKSKSNTIIRKSSNTKTIIYKKSLVLKKIAYI